jgi:hypothetical protein
MLVWVSTFMLIALVAWPWFVSLATILEGGR